MFKPSSWLHLRIPFSFFLMPVFFFALAVSPNFTGQSLLWSFLIIHLFLYPASNGYNSFFDRDEKSIGGLKTPPPVAPGLYWLALAFDAAAVALALAKVSTVFAVMLLIYGAASKAYSHPSVRLKKYAIGGWLTIGLFQGFFAFLMCYAGINRFGWENMVQEKVLVPAALTALLLLGSYPMTQVYQHEEDARRGDRTLSLLLGVRGTFIFVMAVFAAAAGLFGWYFSIFFSPATALRFGIHLAPVFLFFAFWFFRVWRNPAKADYGHTMWLNFISALSLNAFFIRLWMDTSHVANTF
jgi:1,4-dihydroxy-2-naphthoate octaprenyltransferase